MKHAFAAALAVAVAGQVFYQLMQKLVSHDAHPVLSLLAFYLLAALMSLPLFWLYPLEGGLQSLGMQLHKLNWAVAGVAASIVLIELGFLLAYRAGGSLQTSYVTSAAFTTGLLVVVGALAFAERLGTSRMLGLALCLAGIWLLSRRETA